MELGVVLVVVQPEKNGEGFDSSVVFVFRRKWKKINGILVVDSPDFSGVLVNLSSKYNER